MSTFESVPEPLSDAEAKLITARPLRAALREHWKEIATYCAVSFVLCYLFYGSLFDFSTAVHIVVAAATCAPLNALLIRKSRNEYRKHAASCTAEQLSLLSKEMRTYPDLAAVLVRWSNDGMTPRQKQFELLMELVNDIWRERVKAAGKQPNRPQDGDYEDVPSHDYVQAIERAKQN